MKQVERDELAKVIAAVAVYYGRGDLSRPVISMYIDDLIEAGLTFSDAVDGYSKYRRNSKNLRFPIPAQIIEIVRPVVDDDSLARESVSRIIEAVSKFGYSRGEEACSFVGSAGWETVKRYGGWRSLCEQLGVHIDVTTFTAQARDLIKAHMALARAGKLGEAPQLEHANVIQLESKKQTGLERLDFQKLIPQKANP